MKLFGDSIEFKYGTYRRVGGQIICICNEGRFMTPPGIEIDMSRGISVQSLETGQIQIIAYIKDWA